MQNEVVADLIWRGVVLGTPRTYGDRKTEDVWRTAIVAGTWEGTIPRETIRTPVHLDLEFRVNPQSPDYGRNVSCNGPDLDTMVIGALAGLLDSRNPTRPTLRLIEHGGLCKSVTASKRIVEDDGLAGLSLHVRRGNTLPFDSLPKESRLSFYVDRQRLKGDRRRAVQEAAEQANHSAFRAPKSSPIEIRLAFAEGMTRNPLSADWLEAVIDGLGASHVGTERFFDGPSFQEFGYNDSAVYRLVCAHVAGLPSEAGIHVSTNLISV
jgi:hypothetical protein